MLSKHSRDPKRVVIHLDLDNFYVACERVLNPVLVGKPVGIKQKAILATCSYEARERGVKKLSRVRDALELCPDIILVNGEDLTNYRRFSLRIRQHVKSMLPPLTPVEKLGLDELFIDVSSVPGITTPTTAATLAQSIKDSIKETIGFTSTIGIGRNKLIAKLSGEGGKRPDGLTVWDAEEGENETRDWLGKIEVRKIPGFGHKTVQTLMETITANRSTPPPNPLHVSDVVSLLPPSRFPPSLQSLGALLQGFDHTPVTMTPRYPSVLSIEDSYRNLSPSSLQVEVTKHLESVIRRMEEELTSEDGKTWEMWPRTVKVTLLWNGGNGRESKGARLGIEVFDKERPLSERAELVWKSTLKRVVEGMTKGKEKESLVIINVAVTDLTKECPGRGIQSLLAHPPPAKVKAEPSSTTIDFEMLKELPKEIQDELIKEHGIKKRDLEKSGIVTEERTSKRRKKDVRDFFAPKVSQNISKPKEKVDLQMLKELPKSMRKEMMHQYGISQDDLDSFEEKNHEQADDQVPQAEEDPALPEIVENEGELTCSRCNATVLPFAVDAHLAYHLERC
ncbi:DNA/RNA polymerase [Atractiella rhizophila]|nr:DNA/RNA polymerase [Atractiella rhizophila]